MYLLFLFSSLWRMGYAAGFFVGGLAIGCLLVTFVLSSLTAKLYVSIKLITSHDLYYLQNHHFQVAFSAQL